MTNPQDKTAGMTEQIYTTEWPIRSRVQIDGHQDLIGHVTGVCWKADDGHSIEVSWIHNGTSQVAWFQPWRLSATS